MNTPTSSLSPVIRFGLGSPLKAKNSHHWHSVRFYEQQIVNLELSLSKLNQQNQLDSPSNQVAESEQAHYDSLHDDYTARLRQAYGLRKLALTRLYQVQFTVNKLP